MVTTLVGGVKGKVRIPNAKLRWTVDHCQHAESQNSKEEILPEVRLIWCRRDEDSAAENDQLIEDARTRQTSR